MTNAENSFDTHLVDHDERILGVHASDDGKEIVLIFIHANHMWIV